MTPKSRLFSALLIFGISASLAVAKTPSELTQSDCRSIFPAAHSSEATRALGSGVVWTEAWERNSWGPAEEFLGYVFLKDLQHEGKALGVLVGMTNTGIITSVSIKGASGVDDQFLAQFRGKGMRDDFDLARTPEDLLFIPAKIKAMKDNLGLSESIAHGVQQIVASAREVMK